MQPFEYPPRQRSVKRLDEHDAASRVKHPEDLAEEQPRIRKMMA